MLTERVRLPRGRRSVGVIYCVAARRRCRASAEAILAPIPLAFAEARSLSPDGRAGPARRQARVRVALQMRVFVGALAVDEPEEKVRHVPFTPDLPPELAIDDQRQFHVREPAKVKLNDRLRLPPCCGAGSPVADRLTGRLGWLRGGAD